MTLFPSSILLPPLDGTVGKYLLIFIFFSRAISQIFLCSSSPTYQLSSKGRKFNKKEAPLVDPEPTSDISNFNTSAVYPPNSNGNVSKTDTADVTKAPLKSIQGIHSNTHGKMGHPSIGLTTNRVFQIYSRLDIEQSVSVERTMRYTCIGTDDLNFKSTNSTHEFDANLRYTNTKSPHRKRTENRTVCSGRRR